MTLKSDYGTQITWNSLTMKCKVIGYPEITSERLNATNHASGGTSEYLPSKLVEYGEFDIEILVDNGTILDSLTDAMLAGTSSSMVLTDALDIFTFNAFCTSVGKAEHDSQSPDVISAKVKFSPAGAIAITAVA